MVAVEPTETSLLDTLDAGVGPQRGKKKGAKSVGDRRLRLRKTLWPDISDEHLWLRTQNVGFTTIPRTMPLIGQVLDHLSGKGMPLLTTYLSLWCWVFDEAIVEIRSPREMAHEAGFTGPRAEGTWKTRMKRLVELGFIQAKPGLAGDYQYVLLLNPLRRIKELYADRRGDMLYVALVGRLAQVGADDLDL
jgi:hypothetical protein